MSTTLVCNRRRVILLLATCTMIEDKLLIVRFRQGSQEALRQIYDKYKIAMLKLAIVLAGDINTAEDIVHDVFVKLAQSADRIGLVGSLKSYLFTCVVNRVRNRVRDANRHGQTAIDEVDSPVCSQPGPHHWAVLNEQLAALSEALKQLPYEQREVVCLHMEANLSLGQIAALQKTPVNTVKGRYRYGMEKLRSLLDSEVQICNPQTR
jgi:RNA polymerase sigma factor (sigma-70 family)